MGSHCVLPESALKNYQIEHFLSEDHFKQLKELMTVRNIKNGEYLFFEEEPVKYMYLVKKGHLHITKSTEEGRQLLLYILQKGDFFGEYGGNEAILSSFSAQAVQDTQVGIVAIADLEDLIAVNGAFALEFIKWMGLLQRTTESKFRDLLLYGKTGALASTLIRLSNSYGKANAEGILINIKLTNTDIANMIGTSRENVNRMLASFREEGIISYRNGMITIHKLDYFRQMLKCPDCPVEICRI